MSATMFPVMSVSIAETEIEAIGAQYLEGHFSSWDYFQTVGSNVATTASAANLNGMDLNEPQSANEVFVSSFKGSYGQDRVTNDPMEAAYIAVHIWKQAAEQADVHRARGRLSLSFEPPL